MTTRKKNFNLLESSIFDAVIIGGGINGAVTAANLAAHGIKTALVDKKDFASATSQESSNLIWGGIKYLENMEFGLVRNLCRSRNHLIESYPSMIQEIRFLVSVEKGFRHHPLILYAGGLLYWLMGNFFTRAPTFFSPTALKRREAILDIKRVTGGFEYSDAYLVDNDARLVYSFIHTAHQNGAAAVNYCEALSALRKNGIWEVELRDTISNRSFKLKAKSLINAAGPWADEFNRRSGIKSNHRHIFSKGIHLIVNRVTDSRRVLTFFADDGRLFFAIPMGPRTCIGTTDTPVEEVSAQITDEDRSFVLDNINKRLSLPQELKKEDIIAERCGVRPLAVLDHKADDAATSDWMHLSRKHVIETDYESKQLTIFGGKISDCLNIGNEVGAVLGEMGFKLSDPEQPWYGEPKELEREQFFEKSRLAALDELTAGESTEKLSQRLWRRYGRDAEKILESIAKNPELAQPICYEAELTRAEVNHSLAEELIAFPEDLLRRRSMAAQIIPGEQLESSPLYAELEKQLSKLRSGS